MKKKHFYITIENSDRELNGKLLITTEALSKGYDVILGSKDVLWSIIKYLPKGPILEKSLGKNLSSILKKNFYLNFTTFLLDEESLTYASKKQYLHFNFHVRNQKYLNTFFLSNMKQRKMLSSDKSIIKKKLVLSGVPKYELYSKKNRKMFEKEKRNISKKYGKFILVTSRFGNINHNKENRNFQKKLDKDYQNFSEKIFKLFLNMTVLLAKKFNKLPIIYRPHPSEDILLAKRFFSEYKNINVVYKGNVVPWIMASKILIHNKCTTGFEGLLLDKNVIHYDPIEYKSIHNNFFKILGHRCKKISDVLKVCLKIIKNNYDLKNNYKKNIIFNEYFHKTKPSPQSIILNFIDKKNYPLDKIHYLKLLLLKLLHLKKNLNIFLKYIFFKNFRVNHNYIKQKFGSLNQGKIKNQLLLINKTLKLNYNFKIKLLCKDLYVISKTS